MDSTEFKATLREKFLQRDVPGIVMVISRFRSEPDFPKLYKNLMATGRITQETVKIEDVIVAILDEIESRLVQEGELSINANYFEIAEQLKAKFGDEVGGIYTKTKMPDDFMLEMRQEKGHGDAGKLSESLIEQYKRVLIEIEEGRKVIMAILQKHSRFPIENVMRLNEQLSELYGEIRANYKYLSIKPYLMKVYETDPGSSGTVSEESRLFQDYINSGREPSLANLVQTHIALAKLFQVLKKQEILSNDAYLRYTNRIHSFWTHSGEAGLNTKARSLFEDLLKQTWADQEAILKRLALTFVEEYRCAEDQMRIRHRMIESELASTNEYLKRIAPDVDKLSEEHETKAKIALEKIANLKGIFVLTGRQMQAAAEKSTDELERTVLGIPTALSPSQLTEWIRIYSIIFSNTNFLEYSQEKIELGTMRKLISDLSTFHLIQNIAQLKVVIDRSLVATEDAKASHFKRFNDALKIKLHGLMGTGKQEEKSLRKMIEELSFLQNESIQFVIADTFEGFQIIVDAFNSTASDYFIRNRDALLKESRELYNEICNQCLKGLVSSRPVEKKATSGSPQEAPKKSWFSKLFS
jgi:hypothetical protein